ncbi:MAG: MarR family transcriptional regulator [Akkermansia sp.]|nr:MarR family transcriptional regulator [Akkermansia sp.]
MLNTREDTVPLIDKMRAITDHINRAGVVAMTDSVRKKLARLSVRQCAVLANIRRYTMVHPEGVPMSQLAERVGMSPSAASHMIDSLMGQGLVERHQSPTDRRAVLVTIAKSFMAPTAAIDKAQTAAIEELRSHLTEEELRIHERVIEKLYAAVLEREGI